MSTIMDLLANILNPNPGQNRLVNPNANGPNYLTQTGLGPEQLARFHQMSGVSQPVSARQAIEAMPQQVTDSIMRLPQQQAPQPDQTQTASVAPQQGGGLLSRLFGGGQSDGENQTIQWLQQQGMDPGTATMMAKSKPILQAYLLKRSQGADPKDALQAEKLGLEIDNLRNPKPGSDWQKLDDGRLYNSRTSEIRDVGQPEGGGLFEGTSVEAQSLNLLVKSGQLTPDQAAQLGAGKTVTNPADGSIVFLTPRGIFSQPAAGGPAQPLSPPPAGAPPPAAVGTPAATPPAGSVAIASDAYGGIDPQKVPPISDAATVAGQPPANPGLIQITEGKPGKLATEAETRNRSLYTVAAPDLKIALENFSALDNVYSQAASKILPWGLDNAATSPEYQRARNALSNIVQTYNYSVSGASAPQQEVDRTIASLMPGPNEAAASIADKKARLSTMVTAIRQAGGNWKPDTAGSPAPGGVDPAAAARKDAPPSGKVRQIAPGITIERL